MRPPLDPTPDPHLGSWASPTREMLSRDVRGCAVALVLLLWMTAWAIGQERPSGGPGGIAEPVPEVVDTVHGIVVNSVDGKPIARALVVSGDRQMATMTDEEGRFSFQVHHPGEGKSPLSPLSRHNTILARTTSPTVGRW